MKRERLGEFIVGTHMNLADAMRKIDNNANGILFVVDEGERLCGAVSDGDIRRWLLKTGSIDAEVRLFMNKKPYSILYKDKADAAVFMRRKSIRALPVVDADGLIIDICLAKDTECTDEEPCGGLERVSVVIMAGGKGTRLYPYTKILPKPLIPIGEIPIVERVIDSFCRYGVTDFLMTVNYKKNMIESYFADISRSYEITYVEEDKPLGTGGSIKLITRKFDSPLFVANCDSLIRTDYSLLYQHHLDSKNAITVVAALKNDTIPYGVVYSNEGGELDKMVEKPTRSYLINTGMYVINPEMIRLIPDDTLFHMTQLVEKAKEQGHRIGVYPVSEDSFLDMGEFAEMKRMEQKLDV